MHKQFLHFKPRSGFTIVELLVVIVVIGVLVSIVTVAYSGVQQKAYNTKVVAGVNTYIKVFQQYKTVKGSYPALDGCLGSNYPNNACWSLNPDGTSAIFGVNSALDSSLSEFITKKPEVGVELVNISPAANQYRGGAWYTFNYGTGGTPGLGYYLKGNNANCVMSVSMQLNEGPLTQCVFTLP